MEQLLVKRKFVIIAFIIITGLVLLIKLFFLQLINDKYLLTAENNFLRKNILYPNRGLLYDRNNKLMVYNDASYDLLVIPRQVKNIDTALLCKLLNITDSAFNSKMNKAKSYSSYKPSVFFKQISKDEYGYLQEKLFHFPGFFIQSRSIRKYTESIAANTLGYIGEVNNKEIENDKYYRSGDYSGKSGIEKFYEKELRGEKGCEYLMVDVHNRIMGQYKNGKYDTISQQGKSLHLSLDTDLQAFGEQLMQNKIGSVVAIEPSTGEILTFITSPTYSPSLLTGRKRGENYKKLSEDTLKPLLNRAIMGTYSPGSTFKILNALIGLGDKAINLHTHFSCDGPNSWPIRCTHFHVTPLEVREAIIQSCNSFFWKNYREIIRNPKYKSYKEAYINWRNYAEEFGFGKTFDTDIPFELKGNLPDAAYYDKVYGEGHWNDLTIRSLAIGQGELLVTPLQLANFTCIIANEGFYYPPHIVKAIGDSVQTPTSFVERKTVSIDQKYFIPVKEAMLQVFEDPHGTAYWSRIEGIKIGGKTGTVQNPHGDDHSIFIAFAPIENPQIAMAVIVENSGYGSTWAAPIASLMIEKYINDTISRPNIEKRMLEGNLINRK